MALFSAVKRLDLTAAIELYPLIPARERSELRPIIWQKIIRWRKQTKGKDGPEIEAMNRKIMAYSKIIRKEDSK